ncbi:MAG: MotA/TolQ/ExbB proton channel family protein [Chlamydiia bacterium]|nr:MotA/TolQ/ExbB proton channel family protein [Chlamydiia bacterium]
MGNPFISAYVQSDWFGKGIFWGLFLLSILSWTVLIHKTWIYFHVRRASRSFAAQFSEKDPFALQFQKPISGKIPHPYFEIYKTLKSHVLQLLSRNHFYAVLSDSDLGLIEAQAQSAIASAMKRLEKNLFILSTVVTLAPFLGLLGTVWGILLTFSQLQAKGLAGSNTAMLSGLALALATTVLGLVVAIPALVGFNYLKNACREYRRDMEDFSHLMLTSVDLHYRKPIDAEKSAAPN